MNNQRMPNDEETAAAAAAAPPQYLHMLVEHSCNENQQHEKKEELAALQLEPGENWLCWSEQAVSKDDTAEDNDNNAEEEEEDGKKRANEDNDDDTLVKKLEIISAAREPDRIPTALEQIIHQPSWRAQPGKTGRRQRRCCYLCLDVDGSHVTIKDMRRSRSSSPMRPDQQQDDSQDNDGWTPYLMPITTSTTALGAADAAKHPKERLEKRKMRWLQNEWFLCLVDDNNNSDSHATTKILLQYACLSAATPSKDTTPESPSSSLRSQLDGARTEHGGSNGERANAGGGTQRRRRRRR